jgi:hypothetical protein
MKCDEARIKAGHHYPSDGVFARNIVDLLLQKVFLFYIGLNIK